MDSGTALDTNRLPPNAKAAVDFFEAILRKDFDAVWEMLDDFMKEFVTEHAESLKSGPVEPKQAMARYFAWEAYRERGSMSGTGEGDGKMKGFHVNRWNGKECKIHSVWGELVWVDKINTGNGKISQHQGSCDKSKLIKVKVLDGWANLFALSDKLEGESTVSQQGTSIEDGKQTTAVAASQGAAEAPPRDSSTAPHASNEAANGKANGEANGKANVEAGEKPGVREAETKPIEAATAPEAVVRRTPEPTEQTKVGAPKSPCCVVT